MQKLKDGLESLGVGDAAAVEHLQAYLGLLAKWNKAYNLSAIRDPAQMVTHHILDSLVVLPWLEGPRLLDMGSGAGLPGIPLAIARPDLDIVLLDGNGKKTRFLTQVKLELKLDNISVVHGRAEAYRPQAPFQTIISRAFSSLGDFIRLAEPLLAPAGQLLAMKGRLDDAELRQSEPERVKLQIHRLEVPGLDAERHLLQLRLTPTAP